MVFQRNRHLGSREIQQLHQRRRLLVGLVLLALLIIAFFLGERAAYSGMGMSPERYETMSAEVPRLQQRAADLEVELDVVRTQAEMDKQALELVRRELATQKELLASLEESLRFYRSLMAPGDGAQGLSLRSLELVALDRPRQFSFRLIAQQEALKHALLKVDLFADVVGVLAGEKVVYPFAELSDDLDSSPTPLRFRYFQSVEGTLTLPEGFQPQSVRVVAEAASPRSMTVREEFAWQLKEKFTYVGN